MTVDIYNQDAFLNPYEELDKKTLDNVFYGLSFFKLPWVKAPSVTGFRDGLGPFFDANSCRVCHVLNSKGSAPKLNWPFSNSFINLGFTLKLQDREKKQGDIFFGEQLSRFFLLGIKGEPKVNYIYEKNKNNSLYRLKILTNKKTKKLLTRSTISFRLAPHLTGMGLIENIKNEDIIALADPEDKNHDGISGRPNFVYSPSLKKKSLGKYGWKLGKATLEDQTAHALMADMGITSKYFTREDLTSHQKEALKETFKGQLEIENKQFKAIVDYVQYLKVPQQKNIDPFKMAGGKRLFNEISCSKCHVSKFKTRPSIIQDHNKQQQFPLHNQ